MAITLGTSTIQTRAAQLSQRQINHTNSVKILMSSNPMSHQSLAIKIPLLLLLLLIGRIATAQIGSDDNSTITYPSAYFVEYAPVTAQDMLDRIPGASTGGGGFGGSRFGRGGSSHGGVAEVVADLAVVVVAMKF